MTANIGEDKHDDLGLEHFTVRLVVVLKREQVAVIQLRDDVVDDELSRYDGGPMLSSSVVMLQRQVPQLGHVGDWVESDMIKLLNIALQRLLFPLSDRFSGDRCSSVSAASLIAHLKQDRLNICRRRRLLLVLHVYVDVLQVGSGILDGNELGHVEHASGSLRVVLVQLSYLGQLNTQIVLSHGIGSTTLSLPRAGAFGRDRVSGGAISLLLILLER